jgi:hypothetical protein
MATKRIPTPQDRVRFSALPLRACVAGYDDALQATLASSTLDMSTMLASFGRRGPR